MNVYEKGQIAIGNILEDQARQSGNRTFLIYENERISYKEVNDRANQVANNLSAIGIQQGTKVSVMLPNCPRYVYTIFGLAKLGAVEVPINTNTKGDRLVYFIKHSDSELLVVDSQFLERVEEVQENLGNLSQVVISSTEEETPSGLRLNTTSFANLLSGPTSPPNIEVLPTDPLRIQYTSGTTGPSKGAIMAHETMLQSSNVFIRITDQTPDDVHYLNVPLFHAAGFGGQLLSAMLTGASIVLLGRFSASKFWDGARSHGATVFYYTGSMNTILYNHPERPDDSDNPIRIAVGAAMPGSILEAFEKRFNLKIIEVYGLTEASWVTINAGENRKIGAVGKPITGIDIKIVNEDDVEVPVGKEGEIIVRPQNNPYRIFEGYYNMPKETARDFRHCWFHTGDRGYLDEDGFLYFFDRKKDVIRRRGENISSFEVETTIRSHKSIVDCAAIGVPSELSEEDVKVVVQLREGAALSPEELLVFCEKRMDYFMIPRYVEFVKSLPKTPTERVEKYKLKDNWLTPTTWDREKTGYRVKR